LKHTASRSFWTCIDALPVEAQAIARKNFALLKLDRRTRRFSSNAWAGCRASGSDYTVDLHHRALGLPTAEGVHWFWIGTHGDDDKLVT